MFAHGPVWESIDATGNTLPVSLLGVICLLWVGVPDVKRLGSGEIAALSGSEAAKLVF